MICFSNLYSIVKGKSFWITLYKSLFSRNQYHFEINFPLLIEKIILFLNKFINSEDKKIFLESIFILNLNEYRRNIFQEFNSKVYLNSFTNQDALYIKVLICLYENKELNSYMVYFHFIIYIFKYKY